jgi:methionyl-tRNA formyltransferase
MKKSNIIFLGTPEFAASTLQKLIDENYNICAVITEPDRPSGRGKKILSSPIKQLAQKNNILVLQPTKISKLELENKNLNPDLAIVVAYGQIIPNEILKIPKMGFINIHPSLLPKYRGPSPIQAAILNGDDTTGVTIIKLDEKMDHGEIISSSELTRLDSQKARLEAQSLKLCNYNNLSNDLSKLGADLLIKVLPDYLSNKIVLKDQDHSKATFTKLIKKSDGLINWSEKVETIDRKIRAYNPWPGTYTILNGKILKICSAHVENNKLTIYKVKMEGKNQVLWQDFVRGYKKEISFSKYIN